MRNLIKMKHMALIKIDIIASTMSFFVCLGFFAVTVKSCQLLALLSDCLAFVIVSRAAKCQAHKRSQAQHHQGLWYEVPRVDTNKGWEPSQGPSPLNVSIHCTVLQVWGLIEGHSWIHQALFKVYRLLPTLCFAASLPKAAQNIKAHFSPLLSAHNLFMKSFRKWALESLLWVRS